MKSNFIKLVISIGASELAGVIGSIFTTPQIPTWYAALAKSNLTPPSWVFGPVWTALFALMGVAAFLVWSSNSASNEKRRVLVIFGLQLALNTIWSIIFFGLKSPGWAFAEIILLWLAIIWTMIAFYKISRPATWLLVPYILWVTFAGYLNFTIWVLNP